MINKEIRIKQKRINLNLFWLVLTLFLVFSCNNSPAKKIEKSTLLYTCSMHPQVIRDKPGKCPICQMELTPVESKKMAHSKAITLTSEQIQLGEIIIDTVRINKFGRAFSVTGTVNFDQTKLFSQSAKIRGRIEHLYVKDIGKYIAKGTKIFDLYSEELNNAKAEYVLAYKKQHASQMSSFDYSSLVENAKNKLLLWGMNELQIKALINGSTTQFTTFYSDESGYITEMNILEGNYVAEGDQLFQLADLSTVWIDAQLFTSQLAELNHATDITISTAVIPNKKWKGMIELINPEIEKERRINLVRLKVNNEGQLLKPGMLVYVSIIGEEQVLLTVPTSSLLKSKDKVTAWIQTSPHNFLQKIVVIGEENDSTTVIISGLKRGDNLVVKGTYLLNSEFLFKKGNVDENDMKQMKM